MAKVHPKWKTTWKEFYGASNESFESSEAFEPFEQDDRCPICNRNNGKVEEVSDGIKYYNCPKCGISRMHFPVNFTHTPPYRG